MDNGPDTNGNVTRDEAIKMYRDMQMIRRIETAAGNLYKEKIVRGFCHLYSGQEACAVGGWQKSFIQTIYFVNLINNYN